MVGRPERLPGLDGLRTLAIGVVVWHNYGAIPGLSSLPALNQLRAGYIGVTLFFVISGFLITTVLLRGATGASPMRLRTFYARRAYRLLPALGVTLVILWLIAWLKPSVASHTVPASLAVLLYVHNLVWLRHPGPPYGGDGWGHLWSLSVEEQYYLVWPVVVRAARRMPARRFVGVLVAAILAVNIWRFVLWIRGASEQRLYLATDTRMDALLIGAAVACALPAASRLLPPPRARGPVLALLVVGFVVVANRGSRSAITASPGWLFGPGSGVVALAAGYLVLVAVHTDRGWAAGLLNSRPAVAVGVRSYGIYLFHVPMQAVFAGHSAGQVKALAATGVLAWTSYRFVEAPMLRRRPGERLGPSSAGSTSTATTAERSTGP